MGLNGTIVTLGEGGFLLFLFWGSTIKELKLLPFLLRKRSLCFQIARKVVQYRIAYYYLNQLIWRERIHFEINRLY